jgi:hypothetical protein
MTTDALSDVLKTVRLTGAAFFDVVAKAPWVAESPRRDLILPKVLPGAGHLIAYHVLTEGRCFANIVGQQPIAIEAGEVIVFTRCDPHVLSSNPGMRTDPPAAEALDAAASSQLPFFVSLGERGPISARLVCGYLACDAQPFNPLLDNLPPVITARDSEDEGTPWLGQFIRLATTESSDKRAGGESVLAKLSELMFIEVVRRHLSHMPPEQVGWRVCAILSLARLCHSCTQDRSAAGRSKSWARTWVCRARCWRSASSTLSACRRCSTSLDGGCRLLPDSWTAATPILRPLRRKSVTDPRPRSAAPSRKSSGCRRRTGVAERETPAEACVVPRQGSGIGDQRVKRSLHPDLLIAVSRLRHFIFTLVGQAVTPSASK